jgi:hypothetical protein
MGAAHPSFVAIPAESSSPSKQEGAPRRLGCVGVMGVGGKEEKRLPPQSPFPLCLPRCVKTPDLPPAWSDVPARPAARPADKPPGLPVEGAWGSADGRTRPAWGGAGTRKRTAAVARRHVSGHLLSPSRSLARSQPASPPHPPPAEPGMLWRKTPAAACEGGGGVGARSPTHIHAGGRPFCPCASVPVCTGPGGAWRPPAARTLASAWTAVPFQGETVW